MKFQSYPVAAYLAGKPTKTRIDIMIKKISLFIVLLALISVAAGAAVNTLVLTDLRP